MRGRINIRRLILFISGLFVGLAAYGQTIDLLDVTPPEVCAGDEIVVQFHPSGDFGLDNNFIIQLSNSAGNFSPPINLDSLALSENIDDIYSVTATIPPTATTSSDYRIRVFSDNAGVASDIISLTINALPQATISYQGTPFCTNDATVSPSFSGVSGLPFSTTNFSAAPAGLTINTGTGDINPATSSPGWRGSRPGAGRDPDPSDWVPGLPRQL